MSTPEYVIVTSHGSYRYVQAIQNNSKEALLYAEQYQRSLLHRYKMRRKRGGPKPVVTVYARISV